MLWENDNAEKLCQKKLTKVFARIRQYIALSETNIYIKVGRRSGYGIVTKNEREWSKKSLSFHIKVLTCIIPLVYLLLSQPFYYFTYFS